MKSILNTALTLTLGAIYSVDSLSAQARLVMVFDNSGSMQATSGSSTRFQRAKDYALIDLADWFREPGEVKFVYFTAGCGVATSPWLPREADAIAQLNAFTPTNGATPLAEAICVGLSQTNQGDAINVYSDGENNCVLPCAGNLPSAPAGQRWCSGTLGKPASEHYAAGSWQDYLCAQGAGRWWAVYGFGNFAVDQVDSMLEALPRRHGGRYVTIDDRSTGTPWRTSGRGCRDQGGTELAMRSFGIPRPGSTVQVGCNTSTRRPWFLTAGSPLPTPFDLTPLGAPGCMVYVASTLMTPQFTSGALLDVQIPGDPQLVGLSVAFQGLNYHLGNNQLGIATSNMLTLTVVN